MNLLYLISKIYITISTINTSTNKKTKTLKKFKSNNNLIT